MTTTKTQLRSIYDDTMRGGEKKFSFGLFVPPAAEPATTSSEKSVVEVVAKVVEEPEKKEEHRCTLEELFHNLSREIDLRWPQGSVGSRFVQTHDSKQQWYDNKFELKQQAKLKIKDAKRKQQQQQEEELRKSKSSSRATKRAKPSHE
ncbi:hypothetical protein BASA81_012554 [Batrachochytrium salamandrivorans]|nr:hypothetical protein BASA81_012554 [Batrachochytrium salamandrivorans]